MKLSAGLRNSESHIVRKYILHFNFAAYTGFSLISIFIYFRFQFSFCVFYGLYEFICFVNCVFVVFVFSYCSVYSVLCVLFIVLFCVLFVCKCVLYCCIVCTVCV
jgi:hypothetical protein